MSLTVNLIGAGRVGRTLLRRIAKVSDLRVGDVASARPATAQAAVEAAGAGRAVHSLDQMAPADVWLLTVPDTRIADVATELAAQKLPPAFAVHCSGFHLAEVMAPLRGLGWHLASAHPMQSFANPEVSARQFAGTWCGLEGDAEALETTDRLFTLLGARTFRVPSDAKVLYHAAAVITNNFTTVLQAVALETWEESGVPAGTARDLNATLLASTVENAVGLGPAEALTGPAARGDLAVVEAQGRAVSQWNAEAGALYRLLSEMAVRLKQTGRATNQGPPRQ